MIMTNSRYALVGYFITSYPTRAHGIIVIYLTISTMIHLLGFVHPKTEACIQGCSEKLVGWNRMYRVVTFTSLVTTELGSVLATKS